MQDRLKWQHMLNLMLVVVLFFAISACGRDRDEGADTPPDTAAVAEPAQTQPEAAPPAQDDADRAPAPIATGDLDIADLSELDSYRSRSVMNPVQGEDGASPMPFLGSVTIMETEYVREPAASRTVIMDEEGTVTTEMVTVAGQSWINVPGMGWITAGPDETEMASGMTPEVEAMVRQLAGDMDRVGQETVNGVRAIRYAVDSAYEIPFPAPTAEELAEAEADGFPAPTAIRGTVVGDIWIASERNLPPVVVRSVTTQEISFVFDEKPEMDAGMPPGMGFLFGEGSMTFNEERDVTDINQPITIEAPEGALNMGGLIPTAPDASAGMVATAEALAATVDPSSPSESPESGTGESLDVVPLDSLDSYRAELVTSVTSGEMAVSTSVTEEWVADPPARRVMADLGGLEMEYVVTEAGAWMKMGGAWMPAEAADAEDMRGDLESFTGSVDDMVFVGTELVNGVNTRFYQKTESMAGQTLVTEVWVADEADLPTVVVRARYSMDMPSMVNVNEVNVTMINQPISIEPPQ